MPAETSRAIDISKMRMSNDGRERMRRHEKKVHNYYDDGARTRPLHLGDWDIGSLRPMF